MHLSHCRLKQDPFPVDHDPNVFLPVGGRNKVLQHILDDLKSGMRLIHINGKDGSGKTLMCMMLEKKIKGEQEVILLSDPLKSCQDQGGELARTIERNEVTPLEGVDLYKTVARQVADRNENDDPVLIIIDDVERLVPSVLRRLLRLAYDVPNSIQRVQYVLAGKLALGENFKQFDTILASPLQQFNYTLQPLSFDETFSYLGSRLLLAGNEQNVFSGKAVKKIHELSCGNIKLINSFASEALRNACSNKSLTVLSEHVTHSIGSQDVSGKFKSNIAALSQIPKRKKPIFLIFATIFLLSGYMFFERENDNNYNKAPTVVVQHTNLAKEKSDLGDRNQARKNLNGKTFSISQLQQQKSKVVLAENESQNVTNQIVLNDVSTVNASLAVKVKKSSFDTPVYNKRREASLVWLSGEMQRRYTIQLMTISVPDSKMKIEDILNDEVYRTVQDKIFILDNDSDPQTIFLFHGMYNSAQEARSARNALPKGLRKYKPFPLSIGDAIAKNRK